MASLFDAAQIKSLAVLVADREAQGVHIERAALGDILHGPNNVTRSRRVERRGICGSRDRHRGLRDVSSVRTLAPVMRNAMRRRASYSPNGSTLMSAMGCLRRRA